MAKATTPAQDEKEKVTMSLNSTNVRKLKIIAAIENVYQNDIIDALLSNHIAAYEKENGPIKIKN